MSEAPLVKTATRAHQLDLKHTIMPLEMDTLDLVTNHFYYLLLKDPFAMKEQHCALAVEAFGHAFAEKPELEFEISQDMISFMSTASGFFGSYSTMSSSLGVFQDSKANLRLKPKGSC